MKRAMKLLIPIVIAFCCGLVGVSNVDAAENPIEEGMESVRCAGCPRDLFGDTGIFRQITDTILYIVGIIAVIMLIWGGIRYVVSGGDAKKVTDAKNTILYAIIGLIISFLAYAIVRFVVNALPSDSNKATTEESSLVIESTHC
jgi:glucose uptake protein GlcU